MYVPHKNRTNTYRGSKSSLHNSSSILTKLNFQLIHSKPVGCGFFKNDNRFLHSCTEKQLFWCILEVGGMSIITTKKKVGDPIRSLWYPYIQDGARMCKIIWLDKSNTFARARNDFEIMTSIRTQMCHLDKSKLRQLQLSRKIL